MAVHQIDAGALITFCPDNRHMRIAFSGGECAGMPPFSNELVDLARGADRVTFDLTGLHLLDAEGTIEAIMSALGADENDPDVEVIVSRPRHVTALEGSYYVG